MQFFEHSAIALAGAGVVVTAALTYWAAREHIEEKISINAIRDMAQIYSYMLRVVNNTQADRMLILMLSNGGRILRPHDAKYVTVIDEVGNGKVRPVINDFNRFRVDGEYIRIVNRLIEEREISMAVRQLNPGFLRDAYEADGITHFMLFYIGYKSKRHYFGSISTTSGRAFMEVEETQEISIAINQIRRMFSRRRINLP